MPVTRAAGRRMARRRIGALIDIGGRRMHVREDGPERAPAAVLVHGFSCSMHWFDEVTARLAGEHRVIRVDLLGHGCTGGDDGLDAGSQGRAVSGVLDALEVADATIVGHSFGADVALAAAKRSGHAARVVIIGQAPDYGIAALPRAAFLPGVPVLAGLAHRLTPPWLAARTSRIGFAPGYRGEQAWDDPRRVAWDRAAMTSRMYRVVLADRRKGLAERPLDERARELGLPVLAILGGRDQLYPCAPAAARYRAAGADVVVLDEAGHSPHVERPAEVATLIRTFTGEAQC